MEFEKIVAIDWSGAKKSGRKIQVAEYDPRENLVQLVRPERRTNWTRQGIWDEYFNNSSSKASVLIGIDFAFAYPYCNKRAYFPGHKQTPPDVTSLWAKVNEICDHDKDFYGGAFYLQRKALFADYLMYQRYTGCRYRERFRRTDEACQNAGLSSISSAFKCVGATVGVGSVAGFRLLHKISSKCAAHIWPFCGRPATSGTTLVEIYPARFLETAGVYRSDNSNQQQVTDALAFYRIGLAPKLKDYRFTDDERDALVSAAGMKWWLSQEGSLAWSAASRTCAMREGWIFGI